MAYMPYPLQPPNFLVATTNQRTHQPAISETMYGGRSPPAEEPDNVILHEPWEMPPNAAPNHCAPGCSILINGEESGRGRRFSILGKRRNSRSSSFTGTRRSVSEGLSGGKLASLFDSNPFSFDSGPPTKAADIKAETVAGEPSGRSTPSSPLEGKRECALRFGELPHRPPELRRASSVSIGVLSRKALLSEQNGPGTPPKPNPNVRPVIHSTEPEPIDVGEVVKSGAKHLWHNLRSSFSGASGSGTTHEAPMSTSTRASFSAYIDSSRKASIDSYRRSSTSGSNPSSPSVHPHQPSPLSSPTPQSHHLSPLHPHPSPLHTSSAPDDAVPPSALSEDFANYSLGGSGLAAVKEEPGSGRATPRLGRDGSSLGLDKLRLAHEGEAEHAIPPDARKRIRSPLSAHTSGAIPSLEANLRHLDPTKRPPSPPPGASDRAGFGNHDEEEGEDEGEEEEDAYATPPEVAVPEGMPKQRRASHGADGSEGAAREVDVDRASRESRGETKESAILGFQR